nr:DICT sensory domain-containing protein [Nocardioides flavescens]
MNDLLTIGDLETRTGVPSSTLRAWERRLGFPTPVRSVGGQRRYRESDAVLVERVQAERARGLSLAAAVAAVRRSESVGSDSLYATLRARHPELDVLPVSFNVMRALTSAIEDECLAHASSPVVFGGFQDVQSFEVAADRWRELARTARTAVAFSAFPETLGEAEPARVALPRHSPMLNEWTLICDDPQLSVVLVAWELPRRRTDHGPRRFEALLVMDPQIVREAALFCSGIARQAGLPDLDHVTAEVAVGSAEDPRRTASLLRRFATYADD